jgi:hypothetical protein
MGTSVFGHHNHPRPGEKSGARGGVNGNSPPQLLPLILCSLTQQNVGLWGQNCPVLSIFPHKISFPPQSIHMRYVTPTRYRPTQSATPCERSGAIYNHFSSPIKPHEVWNLHPLLANAISHAPWNVWRQITIPRRNSYKQVLCSISNKGTLGDILAFSSPVLRICMITFNISHQHDHIFLCSIPSGTGEGVCGTPPPTPVVSQDSKPCPVKSLTPLLSSILNYVCLS